MIVSDDDEQHGLMINSFVQNDEEDECGLAKMQKGIDTTLELLNIFNEVTSEDNQSINKELFDSSLQLNDLTEKFVKSCYDTKDEPKSRSSQSLNIHAKSDEACDEIIQVNCNSVLGHLHKTKFGSGSKGKCIVVNGRWMTPNEFESFCGKGNCKDWKRTIKTGGQPLLSLVDNNTLILHAVSCSCAACSNDSSLVGPIRPFMRSRRRKRDEIQAFKKILNLKPTTSNRPRASFNSPQPARNSSAKSKSLKNIEQLEQKQWSLLENAADMLINQAQNLRNLIDQAKNQSILSKQALIADLKSAAIADDDDDFDDEDDENDDEEECINMRITSKISNSLAISNNNNSNCINNNTNNGNNSNNSN